MEHADLCGKPTRHVDDLLQDHSLRVIENALSLSTAISGIIGLPYSHRRKTYVSGDEHQASLKMQTFDSDDMDAFAKQHPDRMLLWKERFAIKNTRKKLTCVVSHWQAPDRW